jgi:predicted outer membrane lipoprotein
MWYLSCIAALLTTLTAMWQEKADNRDANKLPPVEDDG